MNATPTTATLPTANIDLPPEPRRRSRSQADADTLRQSIAERGILQPIGVRPEGNRHVVVFGAGRLQAARDLGLEAVPVHVLADISDADAAIASATENLVRAPMRMTDMWRALSHLIDEGWTPGQAGLSLGMTERQIRQAEQLGRLHPDVLERAQAEQDHGNSDFQTEWDLRDIAVLARVPHEQQAELLAATSYIADMAERARKATKRASRKYAIFDTETAHGIAWQNDAFSEPGSHGEWTTEDLTLFHEAQLEALRALVAKKKSARYKLAEYDAGSPKTPAGFRLDATGNDGLPSMSKSDSRVCYAAVSQGNDFGRIIWVLGNPVTPGTKTGAQTSPTATAEASEDDAGDGEDDTQADTTAAAAAEEPAQKRPLTKLGETLLARARTEALRKAVRQDSIVEHDLACLVLIALSSRTVTVRDGHGFSARIVRFDDLVAKVLLPDGSLSQDILVWDALAEALSRMLCVPGADENNGQRDQAAEWIGAITNALDHMPRLDTEPFLATVSGHVLKAEAQRQGIKLTAVTAIRAALTDALPDWKPQFAQFGMPGPKPAAIATTAEGDDDDL